MESLVSTDWLANEAAACDLRIVDASKHLPEAGRDAAADYAAGHIPGAVFLNLDELVDSGAPVENTMPQPEKFASRMQALGLGDGSRIVLYDDSAIRTAARAWFMLRMFGATNVAILDGGIGKWRSEDRPLETGTHSLRPRHYTPWRDATQLRDKAQMLANLASQAEQVIDARGAARFSGEVTETSPGLASGHIPGSLNVPYTALYAVDGTFKDRASLRRVFLDAGVDLSRPVVTSCGSGVTACVVAFALHLIGKDDVALYDGSWTEWGADPATPKSVSQTGASPTVSA